MNKAVETQLLFFIKNVKVCKVQIFQHVTVWNRETTFTLTQCNNIPMSHYENKQNSYYVTEWNRMLCLKLYTQCHSQRNTSKSIFLNIISCIQLKFHRLYKLYHDYLYKNNETTQLWRILNCAHEVSTVFTFCTEIFAEWKKIDISVILFFYWKKKQQHLFKINTRND